MIRGLGLCDALYRKAKRSSDNLGNVAEPNAFLDDGVIAGVRDALLERNRNSLAASCRCAAGQRLLPSPT